MIRWQLKKEAERKFRSGHPWVFSNELSQSPKALPSGDLVVLSDWQGRFLGQGYGHPNSLISFRLLTRRADEVVDAVFLTHRFRRAARLRRMAGLSRFSHRLCFAEGDSLPGLIIDRYRTQSSEASNNQEGQVFVVQSSTSGMDRLLPFVYAALETLANEEGAEPGGVTFENTSIVLANDSKSRVMEGIAIEAKRLIRAGLGVTAENLAMSKVIVQPGMPSLAPLIFTADLITGQKTGFFLDQRFNIHIASQFVYDIVLEKRAKNQPLRVLDLCCYIGQWGAQLAHLASSLGVQAQVVSVDASQKALDLAKINVEAHGGTCDTRKMDVLDALPSLDERAFDVVICDPPAFIKRKEICRTVRRPT